MKKDKNFNELSMLLHTISRTTSIIIWVIKIKEFISEIVGSILGIIWASTILIYIYTGDIFYFKLFFGIISVGLILYFAVSLLESIGKRRRDKYIESLDMANFDTPPPNDINIKLFPEEEPIKYIVTDEKDPMYKKILFLYPIYGRMNTNKTITFFRKNQIKEVNNINANNN